MKKIYIKESSIFSVLNGRLLPQFLFKMVKNHTTSLGDCEAFPSDDGYPFDYVLLKERYNEICDAIDNIGVQSTNEDYLMSELSSLVSQCKEIEKPIRDSLERLCENAVNRVFAIPEEMLNMDFKLVDKVTFKNSIRMRPESSTEVKYTFKDIADIDLSNRAVAKRRFINALIQGGSYMLSKIDTFSEELDKLNPNLLPLYKRINVINDFLLFVKKEEMSDDKPMQGSYVEVKLGVGDNKTTIKSQGLIFPLLLQETFKGLFELFSTHGLPSDRKKAEYVIRKADFVLAEPWDLRLGVGLWKALFGSIEDTNIIPYVFSRFVKVPSSEFSVTVKEILSSTEKGQSIMANILGDAEYDNGYQEFTNRINVKRMDKSLIKDSYFTGAETNGYEIETDDEEIMEEGCAFDNMLLTESQESKSISAAKKLLMQRLEYNEEAADEFVRVKLRTDMPSLRTPQGGKFILGVTRMFCDHQLNSANVIGKLDKTIKYVASEAHINEYDRNLNGMTAQELIDRFSSNFEQDLQKDKDELASTQFETKNDYQIVKIDSFEQSQQYSQYTSWCVTRHKSMYDAYSNNGMAQFYFCLKNGFEQVPEEQGENCPLDEYGLSMLAVCVDEDGSLKTCTCRWNHDNGGNDNIMNTKDISNVIGQNFYDVFKPNNTWKEELSVIMDAINNNTSGILNLFNHYEYLDDIGETNVAAYAVTLLNKYNILLRDEMEYTCRFSSDVWFDRVSDFREGCVVVEKNDRCNLMTLDGNIISDTWFDYVDGIEDGLAQVTLDDKANFLKLDGTLLMDVWVDDAEYFTDGYAQVMIDNKWNYVGTDGDLLSDEWFEMTKWFKEGFGAIKKNGQWNYIDQFGDILSKDMWFDNCGDFKDGFGFLRKDWKYNLIDANGRLISKVWFDNLTMSYGIFTCYGQLDGKTYYIDKYGKVFDSYGTPVDEIHED